MDELEMRFDRAFEERNVWPDDMTNLVTFDFDEVIHRFSNGWQGTTNIYDPPVDGIKELLEELQVKKGYRICIFSCRAETEAGRDSMWQWLFDHDMDEYIAFITHEKPQSMIYISARAIQFTGKTEGLLKQIMSFRSWCEQFDDYSLYGTDVQDG